MFKYYLDRLFLLRVSCSELRYTFEWVIHVDRYKGGSRRGSTWPRGYTPC
jgi:hypothetical protein